MTAVLFACAYIVAGNGWVPCLVVGLAIGRWLRVKGHPPKYGALVSLLMGCAWAACYLLPCALTLMRIDRELFPQASNEKSLGLEGAAFVFVVGMMGLFCLFCIPLILWIAGVLITQYATNWSHARHASGEAPRVDGH